MADNHLYNSAQQRGNTLSIHTGRITGKIGDWIKHHRDRKLKEYTQKAKEKMFEKKMADNQANRDARAGLETARHKNRLSEMNKRYKHQASIVNSQSHAKQLSAYDKGLGQSISKYGEEGSKWFQQGHKAFAPQGLIETKKKGK